jgi:hypothetical protein
LLFIRWLFTNNHPEINETSLLITIDPSYESPTIYSITMLERKIVLLQGFCNSWSLWFSNGAEFDSWITGCLKEMDAGLKTLDSNKLM